MLPETVAASGKRAVAILDGFETVEKAIGFGGLGVVRDALLMRERVGYLFVGSHRLAGLFGRPTMPLYGLAEVVQMGGADDEPRAAGRATQPAEPEAAAPEDPLAAALLGWAEAPPKPKPEDERLVIAREMPSLAELAWERLVEQERRRERDTWDSDGDDPFRRRGKRRRR
jgi:hypothetical protein